MSVLLLVGVVLALVTGMILAGLAANRPPLREPPGVLSRLSVYLTTNVAETEVGSAFPELEPMVLADGTQAPLERIADACRALGWEDVAVDPAAGRVTAVVRSRVFGFRDDVEVILTTSTRDGVTARVRSASRVGRGDLGANSRHIIDLRERLSGDGLLRDAPVR